MTADTIGVSTGPQIRNPHPSLKLDFDQSRRLRQGGYRRSNCWDLLSAVQLPAPAKQLARLYSGLASDRRRNCTRLHRGCNDALLLGSRPSPARPNQSHYLVATQFSGHDDLLTMTSTFSRTNSAAISAARELRPSAQRYSIATVRPSIQPRSRNR